jgi:hypothetical protein
VGNHPLVTSGLACDFGLGIAGQKELDEPEIAVLPRLALGRIFLPDGRRCGLFLARLGSDLFPWP